MEPKAAVMYNIAVPANPKLLAFLSSAPAQALPQDTLIGLLTSQGWTEKEIYAAQAEHFRAQGLDIPTRQAPTASAREAFLYLLLFATLATWTIAFYLLASSLIERWLPDPLFPGTFAPDYDTTAIPSALAALLVAFPLYLFIAHVLTSESAAHPEKLDSSVRKWLTYLALVIAACIFMGDLIAALAFLLRGEITSRFLAKSFVALSLSGGVFAHYFGGLRRTDTAAPRRDRLATLASSLAVIVLVILGFTNLGTPHLQRDLRADAQRAQQLHLLTLKIHDFSRSHPGQLPATLDDLPPPHVTDPLTHAPYLYHPRQSSQYELCATFAQPTPPSHPSDPWQHTAGTHCFELDATNPPGPSISYYGN